MVEGMGRDGQPRPITDFEISFLRDTLPNISWGMFDPNRQGKWNDKCRIWFIDTPGFSEKAPRSNCSWNPQGSNYTARLASVIASSVGAESVQVITMYGYEVGRINGNPCNVWASQRPSSDG
ncbi:hypothetical protein NX059_010078 [Plenodomus lindquistii]|nr:hypothetical protein NX059_010078 [Plenodomus lindquistii]